MAPRAPVSHFNGYNVCGHVKWVWNINFLFGRVPSKIRQCRKLRKTLKNCERFLDIVVDGNISQIRKNGYIWQFFQPGQGDVWVKKNALFANIRLWKQVRKKCEKVVKIVLVQNTSCGLQKSWSAHNRSRNAKLKNCMLKKCLKNSRFSAKDE